MITFAREIKNVFRYMTRAQQVLTVALLPLAVVILVGTIVGSSKVILTAMVPYFAIVAYVLATRDY